MWNSFWYILGVKCISLLSRITYYNICVEFEFNDKLLYMKNNSDQRLLLVYSSKDILLFK